MPENVYPDLTDAAIEEAKKLIGVELRRKPRWTEAGKEMIIRYGLSIGSRNPLYMSEELVSTNLFGSLQSHPSSLHCFDDTFVAPKLPGIQSIYGGADWEFYRPIIVHDRIKATGRLLDVQKKTGEFCGPMALQTGEVVYTNQDAETVAKATTYMLRVPRNPSRERGRYMSIGRYRYTPDDLEAIDKAYEEEEIRGDIPRYWEEVQPGDPVSTVVKGPLSSDDMLNFVDMVRGTISFGYFLDHWRRHPADVYWDPVTGMPDSWDASLIKDNVAQEFGFPFAHDAGIQRVCWIENMVTNWIGNLGFLKALNVRLTRPNFIYDTTWCKGKVTGKAMVDGSPLVDLEVWCENQWGETTATGSAKVSLVSREVDLAPDFVRFDQFTLPGAQARS